MTAIGNFLWFVLGGCFMGLGWWMVSALAFLSIVGAPWGRACYVIGKFAFLPFGREAIDRKALTQRGDIGTSPFGTVGNIIWFLLAGVWLAIGHLFSAIALCLTIIGIPFALQHMKLAGIALAPIGKAIVPKGTARFARALNARVPGAAQRKAL